ncbi:unnamed protein product [Musa hybrid cultivar]
MEGTAAKPSMLALVFLLSTVLLLTISSPCDATLLQDTCRRITTSRSGIGYEFCVASLQADPACASADRRGLATIATRLSLAGASAALSAITNMTRAKPNPWSTDCLGVCWEVYDAAVDHLNVAMRNLGAGRYREAVVFLSAAVDAPDNCEDAFREMGDGTSSSPLAHEGRDFGRVAAMALAITATLG